MPEQYPTTEAGRREKAQRNRLMFDRIARRYDLLNRLISLGMDARWRRVLVRRCALAPGMRVLDLCTGTGDVARALARSGAEVIGLDASGEMLAMARAREDGLTYVQGDALALPFPDGTFDAVTIAFGNRNVASLDRLYAEMRRVAKPGGRVVSLEINRPPFRPLAGLFFLYFTQVPQLLARCCGVDPGAYAYLAESVRQYPDADTVAGIMTAAGLREISIDRLMGGIAVIHRGIA
jgi:demethylmenaquinone methyltransferase/2-methoxy-6-polyprenyl-1,4-benzoquinol methylase